MKKKQGQEKEKIVFGGEKRGWRWVKIFCFAFCLFSNLYPKRQKKFSRRFRTFPSLTSVLRRQLSSQGKTTDETKAISLFSEPKLREKGRRESSGNRNRSTQSSHRTTRGTGPLGLPPIGNQVGWKNKSFLKLNFELNLVLNCIFFFS